jgi:hypothetical protein
MWGDSRFFTSDPFAWVLEPDADNPGVRYAALRDLFELPDSDPEVAAAREALMSGGPVPKILESQNPDGSWLKPGGHYSPKYRATTWQIYFLAELGADPSNDGVRAACEFVLDHCIAPVGAFSLGNPPVTSTAVPCFGGNMLWALGRLGFADDPRTIRACEWAAAAVLGSGDFEYLKSGTSGPSFECSVNERQPCGWGAAKVLRALTCRPQHLRTADVEQAIEVGAEFLLAHSPEAAGYPYTKRISSTWFKFGFPLSYWSDVVEIVEVVARAGHGDDSRLAAAIDLVISKQDDQARWTMENSLNGKMWADIEEKGGPSKWVTLRALRALKLAAHGPPSGT